MGEAYRGLTIQFKADGSKVMSVMKSMTRAANQVESELRMVKKGLRFDGASTKLAQAQIRLLGEKATAARGTLELMRREYRKLGEVRFNGVEMKELSARTRDAATQAEIMRVRYASATEELAVLHNRMTEVWTSSKRLTAISKKGPFENWNKMSVEGIQRAIDVMQTFGAISKEEAEKAKVAVASLRAEFKTTASELKMLDSIAEYQSFGNKIQEQASRTKAAIKEMTASAKAFRATGFEEKIEESRVQIDRLEKEAKQLKAAMKLDPNSFALAAQHSETLRAKMVALKGEAEELKAEMRSLSRSAGVREAAADMGKLEASLRSARAEVDKTGNDFVKAKAQLAVYRDELKGLVAAYAKADTAEKRVMAANDVTAQNAKIREQEKLVNQLATSFARAENNAQMYNKAVRLNETKGLLAANEANMRALENQTAKRMKLLSSSAATALGMTMYSTLYPAVLMAGTYAIQAAEDVDAAYRNMRKTVQGTDEEFVTLKKHALEFGDTHYTSADQLLQIEAIGGQLGITVDNLEAFSKTIANLNIATNISDAEELATQFGKMASVMGLSSDEYDKFADSLVRLGNSEPAMESDILNMTTRFMGMGKVVGMSSDEMLAWATTAVATGQKAEAAGSSMLRMTGRFEAAVAGVSEGMTNLEDLSEEDLEAFEAAKDKLQGYADVARMSAEQFAELWKKDPSKALQRFVEGLHQMDKEGGSAVQALKDLGINNVRDQQLFLGLANTTDVLNDSLTMSRNAWNGVSDQWGDAGDAAREAEKKCQGFSGALQTMKNNGQHLASMMGESLTPALKWLTGIIQTVVGGFSTLDPEMQQAITLSILGSAALGPMLTAYGAMSNAVKNAKASWHEYTSAGNKVARMESSRLANVTGMTEKYKGYSKEVEKARKTIDRCNEAAKKPSVMTNPTAMAQVNKGWREANANLTKAQFKMSAMTKLQAAGGLIGSVGSMAARGALLVGLEQVGTYLYDVHQKSEQYKKSTEGLSSAASRLGIMSKMAGDDIKILSAAMESGNYQQGMYRNQLQETINANAELADVIDGKLNKALDDSTMAEFYASKIEELSGSCEGSATKLAELQSYIDSYNQLTGSSVQMVNDFTGAVNISTEALERQKDAFIQNALLEAYSDSLKEAARTLANTQTEIAKVERELESGKEEAKNLGISEDDFLGYVNYYNSLEAGSDAQKQFVDGLRASNPELLNLLEKYSELALVLDELKKQEELDKQVVDESAKALENQTAKATESKKALEEYVKAYGSIESFNKALLNNKLQDDLSFEEMANAMGFYDDEVKQLGIDMANLGIGADQLGKIGTTAFMDLWNKALEAGGGLDEVAKAVNLVNSAGIDPKSIVIEDGSLKIAMNELSDFDKEELRKKGYEVSDDGTVTVEQGKVDQLVNDLNTLNGTTAQPTVKLNDEATAALDGVMSKVKEVMGFAAKLTLGSTEVNTTAKVDDSQATSTLNNLTKDRTTNIEAKAKTAQAAADIANLVRDRTLNVYVKQHGSVNAGGQASGGINDTLLYRVPAYASGAALSGIVTRPTMTNRGLVGEAGNEALLRMGGRTAVVPLSNRRYVRPFARAVASEMGGSLQGQVNSTTMNVYLDGRFVAGGVDESTTLGDLAKGLRRKARA